MNWIKGLQNAIDFMEAHITEPTDYELIAREMNVSAFYFQRIFTLICGFTPGEYIRNRRLALAGSELISKNAKVIDIALKYGYDTPEGFSRAFVRFHGVTPHAVKKGRAALKSFAPLRITISLKGGEGMNYKIVNKEAFTVIEKAEIHSVTDNENLNTVAAFWDRALTDGTMDFLVSCLSPDEKNLYGICYNDNSPGSSTFEYSIAAKCSAGCAVPDGYRIREIPARTWAVFDCKGPMPGAIQETWHRIVTEFFPTEDYEPTYEMDIEVYDEGDTSADDYKSQIWVAVKKK